MALTFTAVAGSLDYWGHYVVELFDIALDTSYVTGGYAVTAANFGTGRTLAGMQFVGGNAASGQALPVFDTVNSKIKMWFPTGGASAPTSLTAPVAAAAGAGTFAATATPAAGATPVTSTSAQPAIPVVFTGALAAAALTGGIGIEIGSAANLSTLTYRALVLTLG